MKEHAKAIATLDKNSLLAKHHMLHSHQIDLENVKIVDRSSTWRQRLILEAWHSVRDRNSINEHIALPNMYNNINNFQSNQEYSRDYCYTLGILSRCDPILSYIMYIQLFRERLSEKSTKVHATRPKGGLGRNVELLHVLNTNEI